MIKKYILSEKLSAKDFPFYIDLGVHTDDFDIHTHDYSELVIILGGKALHLVDGDSFPIKAGDVFVINGNCAHGYKDVKQLKLSNIMFDLNRLIDYETDLKKLSGFQSLFILEPFYRKEHRFESKLELDPIKLAYIEETINMLLNEFNHQKDGYKTVILSYFIFIATYLSRQFASGKNPVSDKLFFLSEAVSYIENNYMEQIKIEDVAAMAFISERHFRRIFQMNYNMTPTAYIINLRLNHACRLMNTTKFNISEIAAKSGFSDISFFSRQFKKKLGIPPKEYRKASLFIG